jgi:hypothetical protein
VTEPEADPVYTDTDLFSEFSQHWVIYWSTYLDGRQIVADDREDPSVTFTRPTPAEMRDTLRDHEAGQVATHRYQA